MWNRSLEYLKFRKQRPEWILSNDSMKRFVMEAGNELVKNLLDHANDKGDGEWKQLKLDGGVNISERGETVRGIRTFHIPLAAFTGRVNAVGTAKLWDPALVEGSTLQTLETNVDIVFLAFSQFASQPMLKDREFLLYEMREEIGDRIYVVGCESLPATLARAVLAENKKRVRGKIQVGWVFEMLEDDRSCRVTCSVQLNPQGWWPKWWVKKQCPKLLRVVNQMFTLAVDNWLESQPGHQDQTTIA